MKKIIKTIIISTVLTSSFVNAENSFNLKLSVKNLKINTVSESNSSQYKANPETINNCIIGLDFSSIDTKLKNDLCINGYSIFDNFDKVCEIERSSMLNNYSQLNYQNLNNYNCVEDIAFSYLMADNENAYNEFNLVVLKNGLDDSVINHLKDNILNNLVENYGYQLEIR